ncbi:uncharacterized protein LOC127243766 [Andrographis paniculata]|uniref:uncharacterized protein LOC127243766 n=1 Tax=Andrographis paniculata TaxID=175694 RepID=UPI0021E91CC8|nr:uncharacterized protein LOC127243766 [Andrographis paniculata]
MSLLRDRKGWGSVLRGLFSAVPLFFLILFIWSMTIEQHDKEVIERYNKEVSLAQRQLRKSRSPPRQKNNVQKCDTCGRECRPPGTEKLPKGILAKTSNLEARPLWGRPEKINASRSLFAAAVGIKQKENVDKMVQKFLESNSVVMLFHYDGVVEGWNEFQWSRSVMHISVDNQTKWWFAKRFLHPDVVADYDYVFLWDEDLGVDNFHPDRYLSIVKDEGLQISQPALEVGPSELHHLITARWKKSTVHRRVYKLDGKGVQCNDNSSSPPCTGWIEVMAPVFSAAAWRCVWYMIQNDLIHAWGLDMRLGYCAQGDRMKTIGIIDAEYVVHYGLPTLGEPEKAGGEGRQSQAQPNSINRRLEVRRQSYNEYKLFKRRWSKAVEMDQSWIDPYPNDELNHSSLWPPLM